jgi:hypothetical protein
MVPYILVNRPMCIRLCYRSVGHCGMCKIICGKSIRHDDMHKAFVTGL